MKVIFHLDIDSFFVSAERTINPTLVGKPVVISSGGQRSIITAASYEAKSRGAKVPMPLHKIKTVIKDLVIVKPNFGLYVYLSAKVFEFISEKFTPKIEVASIDECYIDVTDIYKKYDNNPSVLAKIIQKEILENLKLPCSIGVSDNKFAAKMATSINKPYGITILPAKNFLKIYGDKSLIQFYGIGKPTAEKLNKIGIFKIKELAVAKIEDIRQVVGVLAPMYINQANGKGDDQLNCEYNDLKSIGNEVTFQDGDKQERQDILNTLAALVEMVAQRMKNRNMISKTITVILKKSGGKEVKIDRKSKTLQRSIWTYDDILKETVNLFDEIWNEESIKFIGVRMTELESIFESSYQQSLFEKEKETSIIADTINKVNAHFKEKVVISGHEFKLKTLQKQNQTRYIESDRIIKYFDVKEKN